MAKESLFELNRKYLNQQFSDECDKRAALDINQINRIPLRSKYTLGPRFVP